MGAERLLGRAGAPDGGSVEATHGREGLGELVSGDLIEK